MHRATTFIMLSSKLKFLFVGLLTTVGMYTVILKITLDHMGTSLQLSGTLVQFVGREVNLPRGKTSQQYATTTQFPAVQLHLHYSMYM